MLAHLSDGPEPDGDVAVQRAPRLVAFGGGTGLPVLLRGLRGPEADAVTAVVTVADDGGSSGRLRQELGIAPPGDVRRCLVALAGRRRLAEVFDYRFDEGENLRDHAVGNIIIAALVDMSGGFSEGVERAARFLRVRGRVLPAAVESLTLVVHHHDGSLTRGESAMKESGRAVARVSVEPVGAAAPAGVLEAIGAADAVVLSPGSLFTSTIPALLGAGVAEALERFAGPVVYCANLLGQPGETEGLTVSEHLDAIAAHVGPVVTDAVVHGEPLAELPAGTAPVPVDADAVARLGVRLHAVDLVAAAAPATTPRGSRAPSRRSRAPRSAN